MENLPSIEMKIKQTTFITKGKVELYFVFNQEFEERMKGFILNLVKRRRVERKSTFLDQQNTFPVLFNNYDPR